MKHRETFNTPTKGKKSMMLKNSQSDLPFTIGGNRPALRSALETKMADRTSTNLSGSLTANKKLRVFNNLRPTNKGRS